MAYQPGRDSNNPGSGDRPGSDFSGNDSFSAAARFADGGNLAEHDYRNPANKGGPGREDVAAPDGIGALPADVSKFTPGLPAGGKGPAGHK